VTICLHSPDGERNPICKNLIANFNIIVLDSFGEEEKAGGHYVAMDRRGVEQKIPLLDISIVVAPNIDPLSSTTANYLGT
jgi:hypothetical protein